MKIKFLYGYSGRETSMKTYDVDDVADLPQAQAMELVRLGVAEEVEESANPLPPLTVTTDPAVVIKQGYKPPKGKAK